MIPMRKLTPQTEEKNNPLLDLVEQIKKSHNLSGEEDSKEGIADIITWCNDPTLLNLPGNNFNLFTGQRIILKAFYMGSLGNENVELTEEEWRWLEEKEQHAAVHKLKLKLSGVDAGENHNFNFRELNLAIGRRGGKTIMTSIIASYEVYKLMKLGDPYKYYNIPYDEEIAIINVANSQDQAKRLFSQIKARIRNAPFFRGRVQGFGESSTYLRLYTDVDLEKMNDPNINVAVDGSICLVCGSSNATTIRGYSAICILFDELQFYAEHTVVSGKSFYHALLPSLSKFRSGGREDGRVVEISSTGAPSGIFYDIHRRAMDVQEEDYRSVLGFRLATWDINEDITYESLVIERKSDSEMFNVEYGAMWAVTGYVGNYFPEMLVKSSFKAHRTQLQRRGAGDVCFMHIDPASTHDSYSLVVIKRERYVTYRGEKRWKAVLVFHRVWVPQGGLGLDLVILDEQAVEIARRFNPRVVTYDTWNSVHSVNFFRKKGIMALQLSFGRHQKAVYYQNLYDLMNRGELELYHDERLESELLNLKYKQTARGRSFTPDMQAEIDSDDLVDGLAAAAWMATGRRMKENLPTPVVVSLGLR